MSVMAAVHVVGGACWVGAWVQTNEELRRAPVERGLPEATTTRMARANQLTRLGAVASERASQTLVPIASDRTAIVGATTLASLRTNVRYERRRLGTGRAAPRDFALTAPNAWVGEIAAATSTMGPSICLVGPDAGVQGIATASRWLASRTCDRVVVVAAESLPEDRSLVLPYEALAGPGAAALVLERGPLTAHPSIAVTWEVPGTGTPPRGSLETVARTWLHTCEGQCMRVDTGGTGFQIDVQPAIGVTPSR